MTKAPIVASLICLVLGGAPYEWHLVADTSTAIEPDSVSLSYGITAVDGTGAGRTTAASFATMSVPQNGKATSFSEAARL